MLKTTIVAALVAALNFSPLCFADTSTASDNDAARDVAADSSKESYGKLNGILGPIPLTFGPRIGLGLINIFNLGIEAKWNNQFGLSIDYSFLPTISASNVSIKMNNFQVTGRFYPWSRAFFVGVGVGKQTLNGSQLDTIAGNQRTVGIDINTTHFAPQVGWRWTWQDGFFMGFEAGVQIPLSNGAALVSDATAAEKNTQEYKDAEKQVSDQGNRLGSNVLPQFALIQFGWFL